MRNGTSEPGSPWNAPEGSVSATPVPSVVIRHDCNGSVHRHDAWYRSVVRSRGASFGGQATVGARMNTSGLPRPPKDTQDPAPPKVGDSPSRAEPPHEPAPAAKTWYHRTPP